MRGALIKLAAISTVLLSLGGCTYASRASGLKPVAQNGWVASGGGVHNPGVVNYTVGNVRIGVSPPMWHETMFIGPVLPLVPVSSSDKIPELHTSFYITAGVLRGSAPPGLNLQGLRVRCTRQGQSNAEDIAYDFKVIGPMAIDVVPRADLRQMATCTVHFAGTFNANLVDPPDLVFNAGTISDSGVFGP